MSNVNFGQVQTPSNTYDPDIMGGWGIRPRNYQVEYLDAAGSAPPCLGGGGLQPALVPGSSRRPTTGR